MFLHWMRPEHTSLTGAHCTSSCDTLSTWQSLKHSVQSTCNTHMHCCADVHNAIGATGSWQTWQDRYMHTGTAANDWQQIRCTLSQDYKHLVNHLHKHEHAATHGTHRPTSRMYQ